ncbi:hypothetical protein F1735_34910, partial [Massilia sp. CCM 8694]|nr:hypothetical protein [Massilia genomosp. 1]
TLIALACLASHNLNYSNRPVRTRMPGGVAGEQLYLAAPYADVRPAWAHSWRCKSSRKLTTVSEVKRNCGRATDCGEEAWSETA